VGAEGASARGERAGKDAGGREPSDALRSWMEYIPILMPEASSLSWPRETALGASAFCGIRGARQDKSRSMARPTDAAHESVQGRDSRIVRMDNVSHESP